MTKEKLKIAKEKAKKIVDEAKKKAKACVNKAKAKAVEDVKKSIAKTKGKSGAKAIVDACKKKCKAKVDATKEKCKIAVEKANDKAKKIVDKAKARKQKGGEDEATETIITITNYQQLEDFDKQQTNKLNQPNSEEYNIKELHIDGSIPDKEYPLAPFLGPGEYPPVRGVLKQGTLNGAYIERFTKYPLILKLQYLRLENLPQTFKSVKALPDMLKSMTNLETLILKDIDLCDPSNTGIKYSFADKERTVLHTQMITKTTEQTNKYGIKRVTEEIDKTLGFTEVLKLPPSLKTLILHDNVGFNRTKKKNFWEDPKKKLNGPYLATSISKALIDIPNLTHLDFSFNYIGEEGAKDIAFALKSISTNMTVLSLKENDIGDKGAEHIANAFEYMPNLIELDLSFNKISDGGAGYIADKLKLELLSKLETLYLNGNNFTDFGKASINTNNKRENLTINYSKEDRQNLLQEPPKKSIFPIKFPGVGLLKYPTFLQNKSTHVPVDNYENNRV